jgi:hypothetical protein
MSKEAWAFISGGLFSIIFGVYFLYELIHQRMKVKKQVVQFEDEEWLPIVDEEGSVTGKALRSVCHGGQKYLHPVVHLHVMNPHKHLFLQKRPDTKIIQPGKWDTAVGGHIAFGEDIKLLSSEKHGKRLVLKIFLPNQSDNISLKAMLKKKWFILSFLRL